MAPASEAHGSVNAHRPGAVAVLGGGSWGTALAWLLALNGHPVRLWLRDPAAAAAMAASRCNQRYLPDLSLPPAIHPTADLPGALSDADAVVVAVPTGAVRDTLTAAASDLPRGAPLLLAAKGLERETGLRLSEVAADVLGADVGLRLAVLSGPNLAREIVQRRPAATVIAARVPAVAAELQARFAHPFFRVYTNSDVAGVEYGGALKNPIAIAAGISDALRYGDNTLATLLTRGLAEITRIGTAAGGEAATFSGLAGLGDLLATAHSPLSRNYRVGRALGEGRSLQEAQAALGQVAEGVPTTAAAVLLAERLGVHAPVMRALHGVLFEGETVENTVAALLARPSGEER